MTPFEPGRQIMTVDTFLEGVQSDVRRAMLKVMLDGVPSIFRAVCTFCQVRLDVPNIRVVRDSFPGAQAMEYVIEINDGLLDYCLSAKHVPTDDVMQLDTSAWPDMVRESIFGWFIAHECYHIARRHARVAETVGYDAAFIRGTEHDADACAVAALFRHHQAKVAGGGLSDIQVRGLVIFSLFWALRRLPVVPSETHPRPEVRLFHALVKLSSLTRNRIIFSSKELLSDAEQREIHEYLTMVLSNCLYFYDLHFAGEHPDFDFVARLGEVAMNGAHVSVTDWEALRGPASDITGQTT